MLEALEQANPQLEILGCQGQGAGQNLSIANPKKFGVAPERPRIVSALADQAFEFPSAGFFVELENSYGLAMVQSVKRVVNILALPFTAQTSMKVMSAQAVQNTSPNILFLRFKRVSW